MNSFFSTSQLTVPAPPVAHSSTYPEDGRHVQAQQNISTPQSNGLSAEPFSLFFPIPVTPILLAEARAALNPHLIKREPLLGDRTVWELFLKPHSACQNFGHSLLDYTPFHAISPQDLKRVMKEPFTRTWIIERLRGIPSSQPIIMKTGVLVCLQDTVHAFSHTNPHLPTVWGVIGGLARAEPGYQTHHLIIIAQSSTYPPTHQPKKGSLISIPNFYHDPGQPPVTLSPPSIGQCYVPGMNLWARPLRKREKDEGMVEEGVSGLNYVVR